MIHKCLWYTYIYIYIHVFIYIYIYIRISILLYFTIGLVPLLCFLCSLCCLRCQSAWRRFVTGRGDLYATNMIHSTDTSSIYTHTCVYVYIHIYIYMYIYIYYEHIVLEFIPGSHCLVRKCTRNPQKMVRCTEICNLTNRVQSDLEWVYRRTHPVATLITPTGPFKMDGARWHLLSQVFSSSGKMKTDLHRERLLQDTTRTTSVGCFFGRSFGGWLRWQ